jgi:uncharacterized protein
LIRSILLLCGLIATSQALALQRPAALAAVTPYSEAADGVKAKVRALNSAAFDAYEKGDLRAAYSSYGKAAKYGEPSALYNIAVMRIKDEVNRPSMGLALKSLTRSAELGFAPAQFMLANLFETGLAVGEKNKSISKATNWYLEAAKQGHPDACLAMGTAYFLGRGTRLDYSEALRWYTKAAEFGDVAAQYLVASMYENANGVEKNLEIALMWYVAAARQGDVAAREKSKYITEIIAKERQS